MTLALGRLFQPPLTWPWTNALRFSLPAVMRPVPLKPWLLALNDPDTPAGEVRGLGLGKRMVCIVWGSKGGYDIPIENIFIFIFSHEYYFCVCVV